MNEDEESIDDMENEPIPKKKDPLQLYYRYLKRIQLVSYLLALYLMFLCFP